MFEVFVLVVCLMERIGREVDGQNKAQRCECIVFVRSFDGDGYSEVKTLLILSS